jgi:hypothetical protein
MIEPLAHPCLLQHYLIYITQEMPHDLWMDFKKVRYTHTHTHKMEFYSAVKKKVIQGKRMEMASPIDIEMVTSLYPSHSVPIWALGPCHHPCSIQWNSVWLIVSNRRKISAVSESKDFLIYWNNTFIVNEIPFCSNTQNKFFVDSCLSYFVFVFNIQCFHCIL